MPSGFSSQFVNTFFESPLLGWEEFEIKKVAKRWEIVLQVSTQWI